eukprot:4754969-Pyramimonas_sp.AAC.1
MGANTYILSTPAGNIQHVYSAGKLETTIPGKLSITAREFNQQSRQHGRMPKVVNLEKLPYANGVGSGAAICRTLRTFTIACTFQHHDEPPTAQVDAFVGNIAGGSGSDLPAV